MIEIVSAERCIECDKCVQVCPTNVFDRGEDGVPVIARQSDCQTCFMCEAYCPVDALFVAPVITPVAPDSPLRSEQHVISSGLIGSYREALGWGHGRTPSALIAVGPALPPPRISTARPHPEPARGAAPLI